MALRFFNLFRADMCHRKVFCSQCPQGKEKEINRWTIERECERVRKKARTKERSKEETREERTERGKGEKEREEILRKI